MHLTLLVALEVNICPNQNSDTNVPYLGYAATEDSSETVSFAVHFDNDSAIRSFLHSDRNCRKSFTCEIEAVWPRAFRDYRWWQRLKDRLPSSVLLEFDIAWICALKKTHTVKRQDFS